MVGKYGSRSFSHQDMEKWTPVVTVSGHFDSVEGIDWDRKGGNFLLSCSLDETVRVHAPWSHDGRAVLAIFRTCELLGLDCISLMLCNLTNKVRNKERNE